MMQSDFQPLVDAALAEDLSDAGDVTSAALFSDEVMTATLVSKDTGVLAGADVFAAVFRTVDPETMVDLSVADGATLEPGARIATVRGRAVSVLSAERVALNFVGYLSGIATATRTLVDEAARGGNAVILDTRKTLPGFRALAKYAVGVGGASNHRMGLYDMVMLKDNHIDRAGSITDAVARVRSRWADRFRIEVECRTLDDVREAKGLGVDVIMLDNMSPDDMREAVAICGGIPPLEASGNIDVRTVRDVSATGVDFISSGAITHSVRSFDFSLRTVVA